MAQDEKDDENERRAEELFERTVRRMLNTPPKPQQEMKLGKPRRGKSGRQVVGDADDTPSIRANR